ncbi:MAG: hypothetical protein OEV44_01080 [Spirochaetota bacterium]|nr:hypothetical protein [Spirochaetota bacterium]
MKLLDSKTLAVKKKASQNEDLFKSLRSKQLLEKEVLRLMKYKDSVEPEKQKEVEAFWGFMKEMQIKKAAIIKEVSDLTDKREELLKPLIEEKLESGEADTSIKKQIINEKIDKLEKIEAEMDARGLKLADDELKVKNKTIALEKKEKALEDKLKKFNNFIKEYETRTR